jgi:hypothetical protein
MKATITSVIVFIGGLVLASASMAQPQVIATGLAGGSGSAIGPGGALFVTEAAAGRISRVDPQTGEVTPFASGLPPLLPQIGIGGATDVAFIGGTAYALVTLVGPDLGGTDTVGIYRVDGPNSFTVVAEIGEYSINNPPNTGFFVPSGVQYALEAYRGGFLVTDGHHNRVLHVTLDGEISEFAVFDNIVPTGLAVAGDTVYVALAGPAPHLPQTGRVVAVRARDGSVSPVAAGARLAVDVEFGRGRTRYVLAQGVWDGMAEGSPAFPDTGTLFEINDDGSVTSVMEGLDRPTSMEFIGNTAYVITLDGEIWRIDDLAAPPFGKSR